MASLLVWTVFLPLAGCLLLLLLAPALDHRAARWVALVTTLATMLLTLILVCAFQPGVVEPQFSVRTSGGYGWSWLETPNIRFALGLDGLSLWLFALTSLLMITSVFASWSAVTERASAHYALMLALQTGLLGFFASLDVILFYVFFEFTLVPLFFLIGLYGGDDRRRASITFFLYTLAGSLLTLLGVIALVIVNYQYGAARTLSFSIPEITQSLSALEWPEWTESYWSSPQVLIFLLLFAGFAIKVPLFPFHTWLPLAHVEAPTAGSVLLAGILLKLGGYGLLRFNLAMTPVGAQALFPWLATIAVIGVIYGALASLAQTDVKKLVAFSSVSHMGFVALGMFSMTSTGLNGSVIQMVNHGLTTGALFACVGVFYERYHTRLMSQLSGLWTRMPLLAFFFILTSLGSAALPGLNGFVGEFPILLGMFSRSPLAAVLAALGMILGPYYLLWMLQRVIFGPLQEPVAHDQHGLTPVGHSEHEAGHHDEHSVVHPLAWHHIAGLAPIMVMIVAIGVYPRPFLERIEPSIEPIARGLERAHQAVTTNLAAGHRPQPPAPAQGLAQASTASNQVQDIAR